MVNFYLSHMLVLSYSTSVSCLFLFYFKHIK